MGGVGLRGFLEGPEGILPQEKIRFYMSSLVASDTFRVVHDSAHVTCILLLFWYQQVSRPFHNNYAGIALSIIGK